MLRDVRDTGLRLTSGDVRDFLALAEIGREVDQPQVLEYWKSAPYLLSFMDDYKLKTEVVARLGRTSGSRLAGLLAASRGVVLSWREIEAYSEVDPANARLRSLLAWVEQARLWELLWLPPALPYYSARGPWESARGAGLSKRLVFSTWNVVPKAVAGLVSYDVERRIFKRFDASVRNTAEERKKRRPLLRFAFAQERLTGMPVLGILYPSPTLAALGDPLRSEDVGPPWASSWSPCGRGSIRWSAGSPRPTTTRSGRTRAGTGRHPSSLTSGTPGESTREWFGRGRSPAVWSGSETDQDEDSRWVDHVDYARRVVAGDVELGRPPADLVDVLAAIAVSGPAVCALRALTRGSELEAPVRSHAFETAPVASPGGSGRSSTCRRRRP